MSWSYMQYTSTDTPLYTPQTLSKSQSSHTHEGSVSAVQRFVGRCWQEGRMLNGRDASDKLLTQTSRPMGSSCNVLSVVSGHWMWGHLPHQIYHRYCEWWCVTHVHPPVQKGHSTPGWKYWHGRGNCHPDPLTAGGSLHPFLLDYCDTTCSWEGQTCSIWTVQFTLLKLPGVLMYLTRAIEITL